METKVTFLGTGTSHGVPQIACLCAVCQSTDSKDKRLRSSIIIEHDGKNIIIDTGPDFRQQMLKYEVMHLDYILYTHEHKDHTAGLDDTRSFSIIESKKLPVYATTWVQENLKQSFAYIFKDIKYPGIPDVDLRTITKNESFKIGSLEFLPIEVLHYKLPVMGFRFNDFTYITDANYISNEELEKIKGSKYFVINCLRITPHLSHFNLEEALRIIDIIKPEKAFLTHISHDLGLHKYVQENLLPHNVFLAYDGLQVNW